MPEKDNFQKRAEAAEAQLAWFTGVVRGVIDRPGTPAAIQNTLKKALDVIGADKWLTTSDQTSLKS